jgi:hypothetical protein
MRDAGFKPLLSKCNVRRYTAVQAELAPLREELASTSTAHRLLQESAASSISAAANAQEQVGLHSLPGVRFVTYVDHARTPSCHQSNLSFLLQNNLVKSADPMRGWRSCWRTRLRSTRSSGR